MSDQYLTTYTGHHGPVYAVRWHHAEPDIFLSASADCTARLWSKEHVRTAPAFAGNSIQCSRLKCRCLPPDKHQDAESLLFEQDIALFTFQTGFDEVSDVHWWPGNPTAFVLVNSRGCVEVCHVHTSALPMKYRWIDHEHHYGVPQCMVLYSAAIDLKASFLSFIHESCNEAA